ncbi:hypothetical protein VTN00DRAFT_7197 [Thermoascus crustaceus]|uniref:uncharacterized protein n=1 Tax=Thermoascus crustaceus TaxID=5088 RepID=UPI003743F652
MTVPSVFCNAFISQQTNNWDDASTESSTFSENIFNQNVRVGEAEASIVISPTMGNAIMQYMAAGHSPACIVCHIDDICQFQLREDTIVALLDDKWDYTDDPAPMLGVYFNGGVDPAGNPEEGH